MICPTSLFISQKLADLHEATTLSVHFKDLTCIKYRRDMYMTWDGLLGEQNTTSHFVVREASFKLFCFSKELEFKCSKLINELWKANNKAALTLTFLLDKFQISIPFQPHSEEYSVYV